MIALKCVGCGATLEIGPDLETFACAFCGTNQIVHLRGGTVYLKRIDKAIRKVQENTERTAAELALPRLEKELRKAEEDRRLLLQAAQSGLPTSYNWLVPVCGLLYYSVGWFALAILATGRWGWALTLALLWLFAKFGKEQPVVLLTETGARELEARKKRINQDEDARQRRLREQLAKARQVLDNQRTKTAPSWHRNRGFAACDNLPQSPLGAEQAANGQSKPTIATP